MLVLQEGFWYARTQEVLTGTIWKTFTYFRSIGGTLFIVGGVLPLIWFIVRNVGQLREEVESEEGEWTVYNKDWAA